MTYKEFLSNDWFTSKCSDFIYSMLCFKMLEICRELSDANDSNCKIRTVSYVMYLKDMFHECNRKLFYQMRELSVPMKKHLAQLREKREEERAQGLLRLVQNETTEVQCKLLARYKERDLLKFQ